VHLPDYMEQVVATFSQLARASTRSTSAVVSACVCRSATSRSSAPTRCGAVCAPASTSSCPRICDLEALAASSSGKIEIESLEEGRDGLILDNLVKAAVLTVYKERISPGPGFAM
jgi:magnesium chelatase subunit I